MKKRKQSGFAHLISLTILGILLIGLITSLYLVHKKQDVRSHAQEPCPNGYCSYQPTDDNSLNQSYPVTDQQGYYQNGTTQDPYGNYNQNCANGECGGGTSQESSNQNWCFFGFCF